MSMIQRCRHLAIQTHERNSELNDDERERVDRLLLRLEKESLLENGEEDYDDF